MKIERLLLLAVVVLAGCGSSGPLKIDATTQQTYDDSLFAVSEQLSDEDKAKFKEAVPLVAGKFPPNIKQLHGMTAEEVIDEGINIYMTHVADHELIMTLDPDNESAQATLKEYKRDPLFTPGRKMEPSDEGKEMYRKVKQMVESK